MKLNKLGLVGRCFLAGTLAVAGLVQGCVPLSNVQEQNLYGLTRLAYDHQKAQERNEAIRDSGGDVNVYVGGEKNPNYSKEQEKRDIERVLRSYKEEKEQEKRDIERVLRSYGIIPK